ncbi:hypothetical protein IV203_029280 [Nitzschia inconspicua]|uniref:Uncharacterized protein n=1 Tax=Nitzschia inconspicua TaxID=303405 RepID=A0A9K3Q137_9STRA|nr:hypothetical protein IV203_029280 [Nitzschia inconspicua]
MAVVRRRLILGSCSNKRSFALPTRKNRNYNKKQKTRRSNSSNNNNTIVITTTKEVASGSFTTTTTPTRFFADLRSETVVTPPPPLPVKTVRFAVKPSSVIEHCYDKDFFQRHKSELWYPKSHRQEQQKQAQEIIATFKEEHAETVQQFAAMYKDIANHRRTEDDTGTVSASDIELPLQMRGLEWGITPQLKVRRRRHIRHVLGCADMSLPESFQQVMRHSASVNSSRAAVTIAQWYAKERMEETNDDSHMSVPTSDQPLQTCALQASSQVSRITGLPPRQTLPSKRMCLWQR